MLKRTQQSFNSTFKPRENKLARSPMKRSRPVVSAEQRGAYAKNPGPGWCEACGRPGPTDHSHCLTQKQFPQHRANPLNWLHLCRCCHELFEHNKPAFAFRYPAAFAEKFRRMQLVDAQGAAIFRMKNSDLFR